METRIHALACVLKLLSATSFAQGVPPSSPVEARAPFEVPVADYVAHEWGTFTSVLDARGALLVWNPFRLGAPLPGFVHTAQELKPDWFGSVRMETPVVYFHSEQELRVDVQVDFPAGTLTEWYPTAESERGLRWRNVHVRPGYEPALATTLGGEAYYAARGVAAATVEIGGEAEKFLFYRGVGCFEPPLGARFVGQDGAELELVNRGPEPLATVLLFEARDNEAGFLTLGPLAPGATRRVPRADFVFTNELSLAPLEAELRAHGLFADEARAMLATWRGDWFEPGLRAFYVVPRPAVERLLPLTFTPAPRALERVLLGRLELIEPRREQELLAAARAVAEGEDAAQAFAALGPRVSRFALALLQARQESEPALAAVQWRLLEILSER